MLNLKREHSRASLTVGSKDNGEGMSDLHLFQQAFVNVESR